jgi:hypothetical protein
MGFLKDFMKIIRISLQEMRNDWISSWNFRREMKQVKAAYRRAYERHAINGRTYYILKDKYGNISALDKYELDEWTRRGYFYPMNHLERIRRAIGIVTKNQRYKEQFREMHSTNK